MFLNHTENPLSSRICSFAEKVSFRWREACITVYYLSRKDNVTLTKKQWGRPQCSSGHFYSVAARGDQQRSLNRQYGTAASLLKVAIQVGGVIRLSSVSRFVMPYNVVITSPKGHCAVLVFKSDLSTWKATPAWVELGWHKKFRIPLPIKCLNQRPH